MPRDQVPMRNPFSATTCHIDLSAIQRNFHRLGKPVNLMPVVKSDAYGHGLEQVAKALMNAGARQFAVGLPSEGILLRNIGFKGQILALLGCISDSDWDVCYNYNITPIIGSFADIDNALNKANVYKSYMPIAIKCNTGMNRLGFDLEEMTAAAAMLADKDFIEPVLLLSHLACADMPEENEFTENQFAIFDQFSEIARSYFPAIKCSLGNSAGTLQKPYYEILRPGLALYGYSPFEEDSELEPAMSVSSPIIHIKEIAPGQSLSYGRLFKASRPTKIAVTACGYASGLSRGLSGKFFMLVNGKRAPQIGRICMGMTMLDITDLPDAKVGNDAWILGGEPAKGEKAIDARELAKNGGTIPYEPLCMFGSLNSRVYKN